LVEVSGLKSKVWKHPATESPMLNIPAKAPPDCTQRPLKARSCNPPTRRHQHLLRSEYSVCSHFWGIYGYNL